MAFIRFVFITMAVGFLVAWGVSSGSPAPFVIQMDPLVLILALSVLFSLSSFATGWITGDYSWVDRLWSTLPVAFVWIQAAKSGWDPRTLLLAVLITLWGARLTFNFARKGGYGKVEDYRWVHMRGVIRNPVLWQTFNLLFISGFQVGLFVLFTLPVDRLAKYGKSPLDGWDLLATALFLGFLTLETVADQQQWTFYQRKAKNPDADSETRAGFRSTGLFRYSRHPNFVGEMGVWWSVWLFAACHLPVKQALLAGTGALVLTALFQGSTQLTEKLSTGKYPAYRDYQKRTSRLIPWFERRT